MAAAPDFPADLVADQHELHQVQADLHALQQRLSWSREPSGALKIDGWRPFERPATDGWTADEAAAYDELQKRERDLATRIVCHPHWEQYEGPELVQKRSELKHLPDTQPAAPVTSETRDDITEAA